MNLTYLLYAAAKRWFKSGNNSGELQPHHLLLAGAMAGDDIAFIFLSSLVKTSLLSLPLFALTPSLFSLTLCPLSLPPLPLSSLSITQSLHS